MVFGWYEDDIKKIIKMNVARTCHVLRANPSGTPFDSTVLTECIVIEKIPWTTVCKLYKRSWWNKILFYTWQILTYTNKWNMIYVAISFIYNIWTYTNVNVNVRKIHVRIKPFQFMNISPCTYVDMWSFFFDISKYTAQFSYEDIYCDINFSWQY